LAFAALDILRRFNLAHAQVLLVLPTAVGGPWVAWESRQGGVTKGGCKRGWPGAKPANELL